MYLFIFGSKGIRLPLLQLTATQNTQYGSSNTNLVQKKYTLTHKPKQSIKINIFKVQELKYKICFFVVEAVLK